MRSQKKGIVSTIFIQKNDLMEEYGITPKQYIDKKAFTGDASDGYPGVRGIGPKTALKVIKEYRNGGRCYSSIDELTPANGRKWKKRWTCFTYPRSLQKFIVQLDMEETIEKLNIPVYDEEKRELLR